MLPPTLDINWGKDFTTYHTNCVVKKIIIQYNCPITSLRYHLERGLHHLSYKLGCKKRKKTNMNLQYFYSVIITPTLANTEIDFALAAKCSDHRTLFLCQAPYAANSFQFVLLIGHTFLANLTVIGEMLQRTIQPITGVVRMLSRYGRGAIFL